MCFYSKPRLHKLVSPKKNAPLIQANFHIQGAYRHSFLQSSKKGELKIENNSKEGILSNPQKYGLNKPAAATGCTFFITLEYLTK